MTSPDTARRAAASFVERVRKVTPFGGGHINETFLVQSPAGDVVLQRLNADVFIDPDAVMRNIVTVHRHLAGALVPEPVRARDGGWLVHDRSATWRAWRRVVDAGPAPRTTVPVATAAGSLLGQFHARLADLDTAAVTETLPRFHDPRRRLSALRAAVDADPLARVAGVRDDIDACLAASALVDAAERLSAGVPRRVTHNDAKLDNILFRQDAAVCIVDLDTLMPGAWFWDVGDLLRTASTRTTEDDPDATIEPELYDAVLDGYVRAAGHALDTAERDALAIAGAIVTFEQAVRFLTDWIEGDVYYRTSRPDQNRDRAHAQLRLLAAMPGTVSPP